MSTDVTLAFAHPEERSLASAGAAHRDRISLRDHIVAVLHACEAYETALDEIFA